jgi:hypothetical protein
VKGVQAESDDSRRINALMRHPIGARRSAPAAVYPAASAEGRAPKVNRHTVRVAAPQRRRLTFILILLVFTTYCLVNDGSGLHRRRPVSKVTSQNNVVSRMTASPSKRPQLNASALAKVFLWRGYNINTICYSKPL